MKRCIFIIACVLLTAWNPQAETYYVANDGSDSLNDGMSAETPFQTIAHAASLLNTDDTMLLKRGDVFYESVTINRWNLTNFTIDAYGDPGDDLPVVSGGTRITTWTPFLGSIYEADVALASGESLGYLTVDGVHMDIARYPNRDWARTTTWTENADGTNTVLTSLELLNHPRNANDYWKGANIRWHRHSWWFETRTILDYDAVTGNLYLSDKSIIPVQPGDKNGWGFYLDNIFQELDSPGEFYFYAAGNKVYLLAPGNGDPNGMLVEGSVREYGLSVKDATVRNIAFRHQKLYGLTITDESIVEYCRFEHIGSDEGGAGVRPTWNTTNGIVRYNLFQDNYNTAISWNEDPSQTDSCSYIERNRFINSGTVDGYGGEGPWKAAAIIISNASGLHIEYNTFDGAGYAAVILGSDGNYVEYNVIENAMCTLNDGGAVYCNCSLSTIRHNIILETRGGMESMGPWANLAQGIWPEFLSEFHDSVIENNTVVNSGCYGIFLENNFDCEIRGNVIFSSDAAAIRLGGDAYDSQGNLIENNVFYSDEEDATTVYFDRDIDYGTLQNNYYCNPFTMQEVGYFQSWSVVPISIADWQTGYSSWADMSPHVDFEKLSQPPTDPNPYGRADIFINKTEYNRIVSLPADYRDIDGNPVEGQFTLAPFTSRILIYRRAQTSPSRAFSPWTFY
ncbi:right-handed parallel beta-helix repeat-containing protein [Candidatus Sumerlaeota bacterium]|nr:right-handed parallel beta-helix repeat-containing protein [Candidatus Sumerlaeota bacterium]